MVIISEDRRGIEPRSQRWEYLELTTRPRAHIQHSAVRGRIPIFCICIIFYYQMIFYVPRSAAELWRNSVIPHIIILNSRIYPLFSVPRRNSGGILQFCILLFCNSRRDSFIPHSAFHGGILAEFRNSAYHFFNSRKYLYPTFRVPRRNFDGIPHFHILSFQLSKQRYDTYYFSHSWCAMYWLPMYWRQWICGIAEFRRNSAAERGMRNEVYILTEEHIMNYAE